jgi:hypothetical protein
MKWAEHVARMEKGRYIYRVLVGKSEERRLTERPRRRWDDNIQMEIQEEECGGGYGLDRSGSG